jgi:hypothetical protein
MVICLQKTSETLQTEHAEVAQLAEGQFWRMDTQETKERLGGSVWELEGL